uniref:DUF4408 domain-containing protein n=1 Tax=Oryza punctata TaxID=4537 RepID=A0A0E0M0E7_ORYPU
MAAGAAPWWWPLPAWLLPGSTAAWFVVLNVVVCAVAVLSSRARESLSPRRGGGRVARRASSALERVRSSFSIFSFPSASFYAFHPDAAEPQTPTPRKRSSVAAQPAASERQTPTPPPLTSVAAPDTPPAQWPETEEEEEEEEDANYMSMEEAYALVMAARQRPAPTEEETRRSEVDAKAEEFVAGLQDEQRRRRLDSIFNYTQMLKQRAAAGRRPQPAPAAAQL